MNIRAFCCLSALICLSIPANAAVQYDGDVRVIRVKLAMDEEFQQFHLDGENYARAIISSASEVFAEAGKVRLAVVETGAWKSPNDARDILEMVTALQEQVPIGRADMVVGFISQPPGVLEIASRQVEGGIASIFEPYALVREPLVVQGCFIESTAHEIGHALGFQHVRDNKSFMRPATSPDPIFTLDKENLEILQITRAVDFARGMDSLPKEALDKLTALYKKLSDAMPEDQGPRFALSLIAKRNLTEAIAKARETVEKSPNDVSARRELADLSFQAEAYAESEKQNREILKKLPKDADALSGLGLALIRQGRLQEAETEFREAVRLKPDDAQMHNDLAFSLKQMGRREEAIREYREAVRLRPDLFEAHTGLAFMLAGQGKLDESAEEYRKGIRINPNHAETHSDYGVVLLHMNKPEEAIKEFREAIRLDPGLSEAHANVALILRSRGKNEEAVREYREAIRSDPDNIGARMDLGLLLMEMNHLDEALKEFRSALDVQPNSASAPDLHNHMGIIFARQGKNEEAMREFREAIRLRPGYPVAHNGLGIILAQRGQLDEAIKEFEEAIRLKPDFAPSHGGLAMAYFEQKKYADAWKHAHLCVKFGGKLDPEFRKALTEQMPEPPE